MFRKILVAVDFSEFTGEIMEYALAIARKFDSELHLIHVIPNLNYFTPYESFLTPENLVTIESNIEAEVERDFEKVMKTIDVPVKKVIKTGVIFVEVLNYIKAESMELVVMGTHGRSAIEHILLGSVAEKVVRRAPCPVMTVRPKNKPVKIP